LLAINPDSASFIAYRDVGEGHEHDCMDAGGRATPGAVAEERKLPGYYSVMMINLFGIDVRGVWL